MSHRPVLTMVAAGVLALTAAPAFGADPTSGAEGGKPYRDVRDGAHAEAVAQARNGGDVPDGQAAAARALVRAQGREAALDLDPTTSTVRSLADLSGALTGPSGGSRRDIALGYVRAHRTALGLTDADLGTLTAERSPTTPDGVTVVRWTQAVDGIPLFDNGLTVAIDRAGRVISVGGSPVHAPDPNAASPALSADAAEKALRASVGAGTETAAPQLVYFDVNGALRLAWRMQYRTSGTALYDAVVDAVTGRVLHRANLVKFAVNVNVFPHYPGAPSPGGTQTAVDIGPYLFTGTTVFSGPYAREWADVNSNDDIDAGEDVDPNTLSAVTFDPSFALLGTGGCTTTARCSWDHTAPTSWQTNLDQNMGQLFWFVNEYRDHLANTPSINFTQATGGFECAAPPPCTRASDDRVLVNADDGAAADTATGGPDLDHLNNANMSTPPDGQPPTMQMYLFYNNPAGTSAFGSTDASPFRDVNGGDAAEIVFHEYTHGLSNRLVVDASGAGALNSQQAGAMGEAWSDWYAMDFLNRGDAPPAGMGTSYVPDTAAPGEVNMGSYTDAVPNSIRSQPLDCPVGSTAAACPGPDGNGATTADNGGYTYGDFGHICCGGPEVHADGEIWSETLWDLRQALITALGVTAGANAAEQLVTGAMRLSPPEPSFLDMRNAILLQDQAVNGGANNALIWSVFANRGMGFFAGTINGSDTSPVEDFNTPPTTGETGALAGTVTDAITGKPVGGARIAVGGHTSGQTTSIFTTNSGNAGAFSLSGLPVGTYGKIFETNGSGYDAVERRAVAVTSGATTALNLVLRRDWAARAGGTTVSTDTDATADPFGCGPSAAIDQDPGIGWSAYNPTSPKYPAPTLANHLTAGQPPSMTIQLPRPVDITSFEVDPGNTCGDGASATTKDFTIETSQDGASFTTAYDGTTPATEFAQSDAGTMKSLTPTAGASAVRYVRVTLLSPQKTGAGFSGDDFIDLTEFAVYGNAVPMGSLTAAPGSVLTGQAVSLDASSFSDDGSIAKYDWDFDGNGTTDASTTAPTTATTYAAAGTYAPRVRVTDDTGGANTASASVTVTAPSDGGGNTTPPTKPAAPRLTLTGLRQPNGVSLRVVCSSACSGSATLRSTSAFARRMKIPARTFARIKVNAFKGTSTVRIPLKKSVLQRLRKRHVTSVRLTLSARVTDRLKQATSLTRAARVRISRR